MRTLLPIACLLATPALADSEASWDAFRATVEASCLAAVERQGMAPEGSEVAVEVNPFGSESYGVALVRVTAPYGTDLMACVTSKATGEAELTAAFLPPAPDAEAAPTP